MQTSSIRYRVADFLERFPPFQFMDEADLLDLAGCGRVKFHEDGETVYREGRERTPHFFVVQQGAVRLMERSQDGEVLRDLLGAGDVFGVGALLGAPTHRHSAVTEGDTILYALSAEEFRTRAAGYPEVKRFLATYDSVRGDGRGGVREGGEGPWLERGTDAIPTADAIPRCAPEDPIRRVAYRMSRADRPLAVVVDGRGRAVGIVGDEELRARVATGELSSDDPVEKLMDRRLPAMPAGSSAGALLLAMLRGAARVVAVTRHGDPDEPLESVVTEGDLRLVTADDPLLLARALRGAEDVERLADLRRRAESLVLRGLSEGRALGWLSHLTSELNAALAGRAIELVTARLEDEGHPPPETAACWLFLGSGGRKELFTRRDVDTGLVYADPEPGRAAETAAYFRTLAQRVVGALEACGFAPSEKGFTAASEAWCRPLSDWQQRYRDWIGDPIHHETYRHHPLFDVLPVWGDTTLADAIRATVREAIAGNPSFVPLLANDALARLPPLTFFRGLVVEDGGERSRHLDLRRSALQPLVDMARVFALDAGGSDGESTLERLAAAAAAAATPEDRAVLCDAEEAYRIALRRRIVTGLSEGTDGSLVDVAALSRYDQHVLKSVFRSVMALLEYTALRYDLSPRR